MKNDFLPSLPKSEEESWHERKIETPRLLVRAFRLEDADDLYEYLSQEEVYRFEPGDPVDREKAQELAMEMSASSCFWAVELKAACKVIGQVYFEQVEPQRIMTWELGYILSPRYQRQGYATEALSALLQRGFAAAGIHRVVAHCNPENTASWKLLEKLGFQQEGHLRRNMFFRRDSNGSPLWNDTFVYAVLKDEYLRGLL
jgi:RimJ/RimL family protein N-acetyltransferase